MRASKRLTNPRKTPRQERSRATVDAITQAATYILVKRGWDKLTTNAIAERAGVNISSLYQYFPNKQAIVAELERRHATQARQTLTSALLKLPAQRSLRDALTVLVQSIVDEHKIAPAVHRAIAEELPRSARCAPRESNAFDQQLLQQLRPFMKNVPDPDFAFQIGLKAAHAVIHEAASHRPEMLAQAEFVQEIVALLEGYLRRRH
ncbi:TetR/AcrR family transcriptional regulator [Variovorax sp. Root411]|uniref:TetR/AcrR family transcriptional regulator n=1 Tax=Variovorax sp. Root411 TaxID=1736530 RepID=UPI000700AE20|nr:TetR/AcrR family transcriptional regulator [Variovorax sp. Root411]KQW64890.1 transcriptional regulator [Variovorax sp. Root411]